eukprot:m.4585 g.4585  ORF g.4585 m.4585 type:complete len:97 (+) comp4521_c0_seq1:106-396(+)
MHAHTKAYAFATRKIVSGTGGVALYVHQQTPIARCLKLINPVRQHTTTAMTVKLDQKDTRVERANKTRLDTRRCFVLKHPVMCQCMFGDQDNNMDT